MQEATLPAPGNYDVWNYDLLEVGGQIPCGSLRSFIFYACSPSTHAIAAENFQESLRSVELVAYGPRADFPDNNGKHRVYVRYWVRKSYLAICSPELRQALSVQIARKVKEDPRVTGHHSKLNPKRIKEIVGLS